MDPGPRHCPHCTYPLAGWETWGFFYADDYTHLACPGCAALIVWSQTLPPAATGFIHGGGSRARRRRGRRYGGDDGAVVVVVDDQQGGGDRGMGGGGGGGGGAEAGRSSRRHHHADSVLPRCKRCGEDLRHAFVPEEGRRRSGRFWGEEGVTEARCGCNKKGLFEAAATTAAAAVGGVGVGGGDGEKKRPAAGGGEQKKPAVVAK